MKVDADIAAVYDAPLDPTAKERLAYVRRKMRQLGAPSRG